MGVCENLKAIVKEDKNNSVLIVECSSHLPTVSDLSAWIRFSLSRSIINPWISLQDEII